MSSFWSSMVERFEHLESELNALDAATGDGDHGTTMLKGFRAAAAQPQNPAKAFRKASGGASGSLFSLLVGALDDVVCRSAPLDVALTLAAERIGQMGQARAGDKTMLDALIPASTAGRNITDAAAAARTGLLATREMAAKRGRARYVEGAGVGHLDAGARSVVEMLETCEQWQKDQG